MALAQTGKFSLPKQTSGSHYGNKGSLIVATGSGTTGTGANPVAVDAKALHGIGTVLGAVVSRNEAAAPGADPNAYSCAWTGSTLNLYRWKVTTGGAAGNPDEVASTHDVNLSYLVWGTK